MQLGEHTEEPVVSGNVPLSVLPNCRLAAGHHSSLTVDARNDIFALEGLDFDLTCRHTRNKLRLVITIERGREHEVVRHDAIKCHRIALHQGFDPFIIQLPDLLFELVMSSCPLPFNPTCHERTSYLDKQFALTLRRLSC